MADQWIIRTQGLRKEFAELVALDDLDLQVTKGEIFGLLGPNGAGKTTTVRILTTLLRPDAGRAWIAGHDVLHEPQAVRQRIGYVSQEVTSDAQLTARENLELFANLYHLHKSDIDPRIRQVLELVDLSEAADRVVRKFSGGMKKKLDIAIGLIHQPEVLFLDEPSLGLDVPSRQRIWDHIRDLRSAGVSILLCTNYMDEADQLCDRLAIIDRGRVVAVGTPHELKAQVGGDVVTLTFLAPNGARSSRFENTIRRLEFVHDLLWEDGRLSVFVHGDDRVIPKLLAAVHKAGIEIEELSYSQPRLDDVFLKFTGHRIREKDS